MWLPLKAKHSKLNFNWASNVAFEMWLKTEMVEGAAHVFTLAAMSNTNAANEKPPDSKKHVHIDTTK